MYLILSHPPSSDLQATNITLRNLRKGGAVDEYVQDQILFYCAMASGTSHSLN
jgi:RNA 3'-terminal phosphate cyclase